MNVLVFALLCATGIFGIPALIFWTNKQTNDYWFLVGIALVLITAIALVLAAIHRLILIGIVG